MIILAFTVFFGIKHTPINRPELIKVRIDVDTGYDPNPPDNAVHIPTILWSHTVDILGVALVENRIIKNDIAVWACDQLVLNFRP